MPIRVFAVTGIVTVSLIALMQSETKSGDFIKHAPKFPDWTRPLGQPKLRLTSMKPNFSARFAESASFLGSEPPSCNAKGCSIALNDKAFSGACSTAPTVCISVYSNAFGAIKRMNTRKCVIVQSIIGAMANGEINLFTTLTIGDSKPQPLIAIAIVPDTHSHPSDRPHGLL